ncbi:hypothetical protein CEW83_01695 [Parazoarcus communis]|uniref:Uncharacterized protein n=1 Tax=Parazoarcus communis TaxID=41977 RepID=A0A2U8GKW6_9RHOO|nr:hypothetical protein [Parazoarcus communis]AWI74094.1 hypothetical protein CEW83_01695 [Parazoarcus communis]
MYEIWLAMNIVFELGLMYLPVVISVAALLIILFGIAIVRGRPAWCGAVKPAIGVGLIALIGAFLLTPGMTKSSFENMGYWVDWANLFAISAGFGAVAAALTLPLAATLRRQR